MKYLLIAAALLMPTSAISGDWVWGEVVTDHYECNTYDRIIIETSRGYTLAEVYSGYSITLEGHRIIGDFHGYGFTNFRNQSGSEGRLYIEDYMVDEDTAIEWCSE